MNNKLIRHGTTIGNNRTNLSKELRKVIKNVIRKRDKAEEEERMKGKTKILEM